MRCIEILEAGQGIQDGAMINRNMRCIEIDILPLQSPACFRINRNMRCIEMRVEYTIENILSD